MGGPDLSAQGPWSPSCWEELWPQSRLGWRGRCFFPWSWGSVRKHSLAHALWVIAWTVWMGYSHLDISCQLKAVNPEVSRNFFPKTCWSGTSSIAVWRNCYFVQVSLGISIIMFNSTQPFYSLHHLMSVAGSILFIWLISLDMAFTAVKGPEAVPDDPPFVTLTSEGAAADQFLRSLFSDDQPAWLKHFDTTCGICQALIKIIALFCGFPSGVPSADLGAHLSNQGWWIRKPQLIRDIITSEFPRCIRIFTSLTVAGISSPAGDTAAVLPPFSSGLLCPVLLLPCTLIPLSLLETTSPRSHCSILLLFRI